MPDERSYNDRERRDRERERADKEREKREREKREKRERTGGVAATLEEALEAAGSRVLSHLESRAHILTVEEVEEYHAALQIEGEEFPYAGPYTLEGEDQRNYWTAYQTSGTQEPPA